MERLRPVFDDSNNWDMPLLSANKRRILGAIHHRATEWLNSLCCFSHSRRTCQSGGNPGCWLTSQQRQVIHALYLWGYLCGMYSSQWRRHGATCVGVVLVHVLPWKAKRTAVLLFRYCGSERLSSRKRPRKLLFAGTFPEGNHHHHHRRRRRRRRGIYSAPVISRHRCITKSQ